MSKSTAFVTQAFGIAGGAKLVGPGEIVIWGGRFPDSQVDTFIDAWDDPLRTVMTWRMVECVSRFDLYRASVQDIAQPQSWFDVERARFFGKAGDKAGDMDLRRDFKQFRWRFIGTTDDTWPALPADFICHDFWAEPGNQALYFREVEQQYYQWQGRSREQRVGSQKWLKQAGLAQEDVYLVQKQYLDNGHVAFVRYIEFVNGEVKNG